jgi:YVTN family beta-propeller protein
MQSHVGSNSTRNAALRGVALLWAALVLAAFGISQAAAAPFAYVANFNSNTVSVVDTATNPPSVVRTIGVGTSPRAVAVAPDGTRVYVTHTAGAAGNTVSVIDTATDIVVATVGVGSFPLGVAVAPDGTRVYVSNSGVGTAPTGQA